MKKLTEFFATYGKYKINLISASFFLLLVIWLSTGTLSPYALSAPDDLVINNYSSVDHRPPFINDTVVPEGRHNFRCLYIANIDHGHFMATFLMLDGGDKNYWQGSVVLRRILYPIIAYPFMKLMGFEVGGIFTNFLLYLIAFLLFVNFVRREIGEKAAIFAAWAVATFPGVAYFGGLPYSYAFIIPACLIAVILLWNLNETVDLKRIFLFSLGIGVLSTGYDLLPFFGFAGLLILFRNKLYKGILISLSGLILPTLICNLILKYYYQVDLSNSNTEMYKIISFSYLGIFQPLFAALGIDPNSSLGMFLAENSPYPDFERWWYYLKNFPIYFIFNYVFSTFGYLSLVFAIINIPRLFGSRLKFTKVEWAVIISVFLVFAFNNLAPQYRSWQFREYGFARIYEPIFVIMILYLSRKIQTMPELLPLKQKILLVLVSLMILGNAFTSLSTVLPNNLGLGIYGNFYLQGYTTKKTYSDFKERIRKYGRYPIGTCRQVKELKQP